MTKPLKFFYDSYAIIESINGNENYRTHFLDSDGIITYFNLMEIYYSLLLDNASKDAIDQITVLFANKIVKPELKECLEAVEFKQKHKSKNLSYVDCLGYIMARNRRLKFLTGDEKFEKMDNVEFVK